MSVLAATACAAGPDEGFDDWDRLPTWSLAQALEIADESRAETAFSKILDLRVAEDGRIYVTQWNRPSVTVFDRAGRFVGLIGRSGAGPGEFVMPARLGFRGDTLWVLDGQSPRLSFFHRPTATFIGAVGFAVPGDDQWGSPRRPGLPLAGGSLLHAPGFPIGVPGVQVETTPLLRLDRSGKLLDTLTVLSVRHLTMDVERPGDPAYVTHYVQPFAELDPWAIAPDGRGVYVARSAPGEHGFRIERFAPSGEITFARTYRLRTQPLPAPVVDAAVRQIADALGRSWRGTPAPAIEQAVRRAMHVPARARPVTEVVPGDDGTLWLRGESLDVHTVSWMVLGADGEPLARVFADAGLRIFQASRDYVWGELTDERDVPAVVGYRVRR